MSIFKTLKNRIKSVIKKENEFQNKDEILNLNYENDDFKKIIEHILSYKIEDAIALYSTKYKDIKLPERNDDFCNLIIEEQFVKDLSSFKQRNYEFLTSFLKCNEDTLKKSFYKEYKEQIEDVQNKLFLKDDNVLAQNNFFINRIEEWKSIFEQKEVPYLTKPILYKEIDKFNVENDKELFKGLISVTPLYFLRKMQLPNLVEFIQLFKILEYFGNKKDIRILDYGCGSADLSLFCAINKLDVTICDIKGGNLDAAKKRFDLRNLPVKTIEVTHEKTIPNINDRFDLIIALEVLEHVRFPDKLLRTFNKIINKNGVIMLGSFPFKDISATGDHLIEAVSQKKNLLNYINTNWTQLEEKDAGNTFIKK